jgi:hypothetical protein
LSSQAFYVLDNGLATYAELDAHLTLEDAITMIEFHQVSAHNKALIKELQDELGNGR